MIIVNYSSARREYDSSSGIYIYKPWSSGDKSVTLFRDPNNDQFVPFENLGMTADEWRAALEANDVAERDSGEKTGL